MEKEEREENEEMGSGSEEREVIKQRMKDGMVAEGSEKGEHKQLNDYERVNTTREELRYAWTYRVGQTLDVGRGGARDVGIRGGRYDVLKVHANGKVELADGRRKIRFDPQRLSPTEPRDRLTLYEKDRKGVV